MVKGLIGILFLILSHETLACSCSPIDENWSTYDVIFHGRAANVRQVDSQLGGQEVTFEVFEQFQGDARETVQVFSGNGSLSCGTSFSVDTNYIVFGDATEKGVSTYLCDPTRQASRAEHFLEALRIGKPSGSWDCADTAPNGDGWGWDGSTSCRVPVGDERICIDVTEPIGDGRGLIGDGNGWFSRYDTCQVSIVSDLPCTDSEPVGDGWGWNGVESCIVPAATPTCVDTPPAGDGWGWNGAESCSVPTAIPTCVDTPPAGDGWGWDGSSSCRVVAG